MILAIDIGATKTLVAYLTEKGDISFQQKFPTPKTYPEWLKQISELLTSNPHDFSITVVAAPGHIDRDIGEARNFGNLSWGKATLRTDLHKLTNTQVIVENDTKLAGLSEATYLIGKYKNVLYITISTGISGALVVDGKLDPELQNSEGGHILIEHEGKLQTWEKLASGSTIFKEYGKRASDINDPKVWDKIAYKIALGLYNQLAIIQPDAVVIGGGVGTHFKKYREPLLKHLHAMQNPLVPIPPILGAKHAEEAVVYGCYYLGRSFNAQDQGK